MAARSPVLVLLQQHLLCAAVGSKHRHVDLGVCSGVLHVSCRNVHLVNNLGKETTVCVFTRETCWPITSLSIIMILFVEKQSRCDLAGQSECT